MHSQYIKIIKRRAACALFTHIQLSVSATVSTFYYFWQQGATVYTHLSIDKDDAATLFDALASKPGEFGAVTRATLDLHFADFCEVYFGALDASMWVERVGGRFSLRFNRYLPHMPELLLEREVKIVQAEIRRINSAPTKARAGYYEDRSMGFFAFVERVCPNLQNSYKTSVPLYAQNITVGGPSLAKAQMFNSKLSCGHYGRFLVNAFE
ncbi:MAG TPA: hypothetical protein VK497_06250 [Candidatus Saccharimonadales bacterium]|nr:hypothetical protein [Candidatus Saccharimonadales bacterium]